jgi:hypothetical protein
LGIFFQEVICGVYLLKKIDSAIKKLETLLRRWNTHLLNVIFCVHLMLVISETIGYSFVINMKKPVDIVIVGL